MQEESGLVLALAAALHLPFQAVLAKELDHTPWVGITFWDLIAPLFLFIVGLSLPFAIQSRLRRGESRKTILYHILRRTALLIVLGLVFNGILQLNFSDFRYTGVLQRIALSYVFAAIITLMTGCAARSHGRSLCWWVIGPSWRSSLCPASAATCSPSKAISRDTSTA